MNKVFVFVCMISMACVSWLPAEKNNTVHHFTFTFKNKVGKADLQLSTQYKNPFGEDMIINKFKYYVSHIYLVTDKGKVIKVSSDTYLIDAADSTTATIQFSANVDKVMSIQFLLGVDSIHNVSGVQTDALDPMNGMFWTWNSGYVMAKIEGTSTFAKVPGNLFTQDVGGFKTGENTARKIKLATGDWQVAEQDVVTIEADINKWFQSKNSITIADNPVCHSPGELAVKLADNYATMFKIASIK